MASYTNISGVKLITTGDEAGTWGASTNTNLEILDAASKGFKKITMTDADYTLPLDNNPSAVENGHYAGIEFAGSNSAERTITLEQNDHTLVYTFLNNTGQNLVIQQGDGSGGTVTIADGFSAMVFCDGAGTGAKVTDVSSAAKAQALANSRNFSITGDITAAAVAFDGTGNVALSAGITADTIVDADINSSAAIADTKLATISTASKVSNSATTATDANTASAIVARDASGDFSAGTITATLSGDVTKTGDFTVDASGDIILDADGSQIYFKDNGGVRYTFNLDATPSMDVSGEFTVNVSSDITLDADGGDIYLKDNNVTAGRIDVSTANQLNFHSGNNNEQFKVVGTGVNAVGGLRVGDTTAPTDNDIYAVADIEAGNDIAAGNDVSVANEIKMTAGASDWTFEVDGSNDLVIQYNGTSLFKLSSAGKLQILGDIETAATL
jgi:hypothetical protein